MEDLEDEAKTMMMLLYGKSHAQKLKKEALLAKQRRPSLNETWTWMMSVIFFKAESKIISGVF